MSMHPVIAKTFGGLSPQYHFRHFVFGLIFPVFIYFMASRGTHPIQLNMILFMVVNTVLYPYSRFVYESIANFVLGQNVFFVNALFMLFVKLITMLLCWVCAIFVAPIGLGYLYYHHSKAG
jgi:hypothetical protein